jgi:hypothetical protein
VKRNEDPCLTVSLVQASRGGDPTKRRAWAHVVEFAEESETAAEVNLINPCAASVPEFGVVSALTEHVAFANLGSEQVGRYSPRAPEVHTGPACGG